LDRDVSSICQSPPAHNRAGLGSNPRRPTRDQRSTLGFRPFAEGRGLQVRILGWSPRETAMIAMPISIDDWDLYRMRGSEQAAKELTAAMDAAVTELSKGLDGDPATFLARLFGKHMAPVHDKWADNGAADSEPTWVSRNHLRKVANELYGTTMCLDF
jgi:hypothetical protein